MNRSMLKSKIHRARVTDANLDYEGSITIDATLLDAADIIVGEHVHIWNITRGTRIETYAIEGEAHSGTICLNGAAAHQNQPGDLIIIAAFADYSEKDLESYASKIVLVDRDNRMVKPDHKERPHTLSLA